MIRKKQQETSALTEKAVHVIALHILKRKANLAAVMNKWANHFSRKQQHWLLVAFCIVFGFGLVLCLMIPYGRLAMNEPGNNYKPIHIGAPSDQPKPAPFKSNDSLIIK